MPRMLGMRGLPSVDLQGLPPEAAALIAQMRQRLEQQERQIAEHQALLQRKDRELALREARLEKVNFELARLKRWKFGAKTEAMSAEQRRLFEETLAEDEASLQAQLDRLREEAAANEGASKPKTLPRRPRREALPAQLRRVEHHHEPENTTCPTPGCGVPMARIGEDVSERLDIVPAEFFVHRHIYGKWACRCCQTLKQQPAAPEVIDGGIAASGLLAHTLISRFADHLPYYRQEGINARSGVHTPRSTLAAWAGQAGAALEPLTTRTSASCWPAACCMPTRRRWRCSTRARARRAGPTSGPTRAAGTTPHRAWSTTSASVAVRSTRWHSSAGMTGGANGDGRVPC